MNKQFYNTSTSLTYYLRNNSDVDAYCTVVLKEIPAYESKAKILAAILDPSKRPPKCKICGKYIPYTLVKNKKKIGKQAIFCSLACAMTDEGKRIQVEIYKKNNPINPMQRPEVREKQRQSILKKYGVDNVSKLPAIREKANNTNYERYGVYNMFQHEEVKEKLASLIKKRKHPICNSESDISLSAINELYTWLLTYTNCEKINNFILVNNKVYIVINNLTWSDESQNYHLDKTTEAASKGIRMIHIFEDEWRNKQNIIKARLKNIIGKTPFKIYGRNCIVKDVDVALSNKFLNKYHLQGKDNSSIRLGLYYKGRLVALMTFGKPRFNKNYKWELIRYATVSNFNIVGGASKLLAYFRKKFQGSIISYTDRRFSEGNLYKALNFKHIGNSRPNYFYTKNCERLSRYKCQKHKLKDLLGEGYDEQLSEHQNMINNKFNKIWDCGNMVFILDN